VDALLLAADQTPFADRDLLALAISLILEAIKENKIIAYVFFLTHNVAISGPGVSAQILDWVGHDGVRPFPAS